MFGRGLSFLTYEIARICTEQIGRSMDATQPVFSFIPPLTINEHYSLTPASSRTRNHPWYEKAEERKRRKAPTRLVYFWGHFAPDFRWTCWIYRRKSPAFRSRKIPTYSFLSISLPPMCPFSTNPSFPNFVKSARITAVVRRDMTLSKDS